jgi:hypothetical protein
MSKTNLFFQFPLSWIRLFVVFVSSPNMTGQFLQVGYDTSFHIHNLFIIHNNLIILHCTANEIDSAKPDLCTEAGGVFRVIQTFDNRWHNILRSSSIHLSLQCSVSFPRAFVKQFIEPLFTWMALNQWFVISDTTHVEWALRTGPPFS